MDNELLYFSDREQGPTPMTKDQVNDVFWRGFVAYVGNLLNNHYLAQDFPLMCPHQGVQQRYCADRDAVGIALRSEIPGAGWPLDPASTPETLVAMDVVEFFHRHVSQPLKLAPHDDYGHDHIRSFDKKRKTRITYRHRVNVLFHRNGLAFRLNDDGKIERLHPPVLREALASATFRTGDSDLDALLDTARSKFGDPDVAMRRHALEKLWDAWEKLKTIEPGKSTKKRVEALLSKAVPDQCFRAEIDSEANNLWKIGNDYSIRHHNTAQKALPESEYVDYLFHRMFALIWLLLKRTGRLK